MGVRKRFKYEGKKGEPLISREWFVDTTGGGVSERKIHCFKIEDLHYAWEDSGFVKKKKRHSINLELLIILHLPTTSTSPCFFLALQQRFTAVEPHLFTSAPVQTSWASPIKVKLSQRKSLRTSELRDINDDVFREHLYDLMNPLLTFLPPHVS